MIHYAYGTQSVLRKEVANSLTSLHAFKNTMSTINSIYTIQDNSVILDNTGARYVLKIRDLPAHEKPREKLIKHGPGALSAPELLAVILNVGTKKEGVLETSARILKEYGEKTLMSRTGARAMADDLGIPIGKATQIIACGELGRRFFKKQERNSATIRTPKDVFEYVGDMRTLPKEHLRGIYLNTHHKVIHDEVISIGTVDANIIHPREVWKPALEYSAVAVILVHNHPSGIALPSPADIEVTEQLTRAGKLLGIDLLDHVIVTKTEWKSIIKN